MFAHAIAKTAKKW